MLGIWYHVSWTAGLRNAAGRHEHTMQVRNIMQTKVVTARSTSTITEVAKQMKSNDVGSVIITENDKPVGIVTDRDIVLNHVAAGHLRDCPVQEAVSKGGAFSGLVTITPDMDILEAAQQLGTHKVGRLPVVESGKLVGILSAGDVTRELKKALDGLMTEGEKAEK